MNNTEWISRKLILVMGKGGVGKSVFARTTAEYLSRNKKKVLLCHPLQLQKVAQELREINPYFFEIYLNANDSFEEYIGLKLKLPALTKIFIRNKITQYLVRAAPGIRELVLLGKAWHEQENYDHVIVDMPSTGYALAMLYTPYNFAKLFPGGPVYNDCHDMLRRYLDPLNTAMMSVALPEEMSLQESLELSFELKTLMNSAATLLKMDENRPLNPPWLVVNRKLQWPTLLSDEFIQKNTQGLSESITKALDHQKKRAGIQESVVQEIIDPKCFANGNNPFLIPECSLNVSEQMFNHFKASITTSSITSGRDI